MQNFPYLIQENERTNPSYHATFIQDSREQAFRGVRITPPHPFTKRHSQRDIPQEKTPKSPRVAKISAKYFSQWERYVMK
jgi:hypothetical protein